jgi:5-methyltetrahydropteroyltriglutamate--homocysteine methyltransferase
VSAATGPIATTVVGSYPQPGWLIYRERLGARVPRIRMPEIWRVDPEVLAEAQNDATLLAIRDMERAGIDIITDGEMRRESYSNRFATALEGIDPEQPATIINRLGKPASVPRVVGPIRRVHPVLVADVEFLRRNTSLPIKITLPGPFTLSQQVADEHYGDDEALGFAFAAVVNEEVLALKAAGADIVQLDEPWLDARPEAASRYAVRVIDRALEGIPGATAVHVCFGYAAVVGDKPQAYSFLPELAGSSATQISIEAAQSKLDLSVLDELSGKDVMLGVIDLGSPVAEPPDAVAARIRAALEHLRPDRLVVAPDCGMKYLPRELAYAKLRALAEGARIVRHEIGG